MLNLSGFLQTDWQNLKWFGGFYQLSLIAVLDSGLFPFFLTGNSCAFSQGLNVITDPCVKDASVPSPTASWWESTIPRGMKSVCSAPCVNSPSPTAVTSEKGNFTANTTTNSKHSFREGLFAFPPSLSHFLSLPLSLCVHLFALFWWFSDFFKIIFFKNGYIGWFLLTWPRGLLCAKVHLKRHSAVVWNAIWIFKKM